MREQCVKFISAQKAVRIAVRGLSSLAEEIDRTNIPITTEQFNQLWNALNQAVFEAALKELE